MGKAPAGAAPGAPREPLAIKWSTPSEWQVTPQKSSMRYATYSAPGQAGAAEVAVFYFGQKMGGSIDANLERWVHQFGEGSETATKSEMKQTDITISTVRIENGTYAGGMLAADRGEKKNWALFGAIAEAPSGKYFFKMTGPAETVAAQSESFVTLLKSITALDPAGTQE